MQSSSVGVRERMGDAPAGLGNASEPGLAHALASRRRLVWLRRTSPLIWLCWLTLAVFISCGVFADVLAPHDPATQELRARLRPPLGFGGTSEYPLGTDPLGRDLLSRLIFGARVSLAIGFAGMLAGVSLLGRSVPVLVLLAGFSGWGAYTRLARGMTLKTREQQYLLSARALGAGNGRVLLRHVLPNIAAPLVVMATLNLTEVIFLESSLSFLGVGVKPPTASWGSMVSDGRDYLHSAWWVGVLPGLAIMLVTMGISLTGDWLRDVLDPTLRCERT
jgi:peptide/nickel transport system permease protein